MSAPASHIKLTPADITPVVAVVGDPFRALAFAQKCTSFKELAWNREYRSFRVEYDGEEFTLISHGIGGPGAAICFEELIQIGAKIIIRLGTCGSLQYGKIVTGDVVVCTAAVREDGHSHLLVPAEFPAVADIQITQSLIESGEKLQTEGVKVHHGICLSSGLFYPAPVVTGHCGNSNSLVTYSKAGAVGVEMESGALYTIASVRGIRAAGVFVVDGCPLATSSGNPADDPAYDPHGVKVKAGKEQMFKMGMAVAAEWVKRYAAENHA